MSNHQCRARPVSGTVAVSNSFLLDGTYTGRMPAGASPADNESNTNTALSRIGGYTFVFDGTPWDRWTGAVTGPLTDTQLRATPVPVSGTVAAVNTGGNLTNSYTIISANGGVTGTFNALTPFVKLIALVA